MVNVGYVLLGVFFLLLGAVNAYMISKADSTAGALLGAAAAGICWIAAMMWLVQSG